MNKKLLIIVLGILAAGFATLFVVFDLESQAPQTPEAGTAPAAPMVNIDELKTKAQAGDAKAQTQLGWAYQKGTGVKADMKEAVNWFQKGAAQNAPEALDALGEMTQAGQGTKRDLDEAIRLYRLAADKGNVAAQYNLAYLYEQGLGVDKDQTQAAHWYQLAAEGGDPVAQYDLGQRYMLGVGVTTNLVEALKWLALASAQGQTDSARLLADLKSRAAAAEIAEAGRLAQQFVVRSATASK
jgi:hypothetical protein